MNLSGVLKFIEIERVQKLAREIEARRKCLLIMARDER